MGLSRWIASEWRKNQPVQICCIAGHADVRPFRIRIELNQLFISDNVGVLDAPKSVASRVELYTFHSQVLVACMKVKRRTYWIFGQTVSTWCRSGESRFEKPNQKFRAPGKIGMERKRRLCC